MSTAQRGPFSCLCVRHFSAPCLISERTIIISLPGSEGGVPLVRPPPCVFEEADPDLMTGGDLLDQLVLFWAPDAHQVCVVLPAVQLRIKQDLSLGDQDVSVTTLLVFCRKNT